MESTPGFSEQAGQNEPQMILGMLGALEVRLAKSPQEVYAAKRVRQKVFGNHLSRPDKSDEDDFDGFCDHLIVVDHDRMKENHGVVATYRLLPHHLAAQKGGYYSAGEFGLQPLLAAHADKKFIEFGRSCVLPEYRDRRVMELLWLGNWRYVQFHRQDVMFGCASFAGTDPFAHKMPLAFLHHHAAATGKWAVKARGDRGVHTDFMPRADVDTKAAIRALPPLIKGYLRLGALFSIEAVIDHDFGTVDVLVVLPVSRLNQRYLNYFGRAV